ncbi:hypothetical protein IMCC26134_03495 [Verrucomicrobia bacterium IMCC26134]|nr:hypothetical protein IMCC26134_03495 [Verrucomicrobia bacterium IMCC26134]
MFTPPISFRRRMDSPRAAFTLIELLTVIAIVGILAAIIIPTVGRVRSAARDAVGLSHLRQIGLAASLYADENRGRFPYSYKANEYDFSSVLAAYIGAAGTETYGNNKATSDIFRDPSATIPLGDLHYTAHPVLMPHFANGPQFNRARLRRPSETVLVADGTQPLSGNTHVSFWATDGSGAWTPFAGNASDDAPIAPGPDIDNDSSGGHLRFRAAGGTACKVVFADGHTRILRKEAFLRRYIRLEP